MKVKFPTYSDKCKTATVLLALDQHMNSKMKTIQ